MTSSNPVFAALDKDYATDMERQYSQAYYKPVKRTTRKGKRVPLGKLHYSRIYGRFV